MKESKANPARSISEIREALGVRLSDNLINAQIILLVEGENDKNALTAILPIISEKVGAALQNGVIMIDHLSSATKLTYKASFYKSMACNVMCLLDHDKEGRDTAENAKKELTIKDSETFFCSVPHMADSEFEDLYDVAIYGDHFKNKFGIDPRKKPRHSVKSKWSDKIEKVFLEAGMPFSKSKKIEIKNWLSNFAKDNPTKIINSNLLGPLETLTSALESKLK